MSSDPGQSTASEVAGKFLQSTSGHSESAPMEDMHTESSKSLDESFRVPVTTQLSDHDSNESIGGFTNVDVHHIYKEWLQQQPKQSMQILAVMFMDRLLERFNMTTVGAAKEVGLLFGLNKKQFVCSTEISMTNQGHFTDSKRGKHLYTTVRFR